jgi:hypothetical protein
MNLMANTNDNLIEKIVYLMEKDKSFDAPKDAIQWSKNIFKTRAIEPKKSFISKVFAVLKLDLAGGQPVFGERSGSASSLRQMLFQAGENSVDLRLSNGELKGQILGEGFGNAEVKLGEFVTMTNELSEFKFSNVPTGKYDLVLKSGEREVVIEGLEVK